MRASGSIAIQPSHPIWMVLPDFAIPFVSFVLYILKKKNKGASRIGDCDAKEVRLARRRFADRSRRVSQYMYNERH